MNGGVTRIALGISFFATFIIGAVASSTADETPPAERRECLFGMVTALSGPTAHLGQNVRAGVLAALAEANADQSCAHRFRLLALDDGYEPSRTVPQMQRLIDEEQVLAVVGNVGTPTAVAAVPIANARRTPFVGAFTGGGVLRKTQPDRYVINFRASYAQETAAMIDALVEVAGISVDEIGFFVQRDSFGDAGFAGGRAALKRHGLTDVARIPLGYYERNTASVRGALGDLLLTRKRLRAIIMVGTSAPCAAFIREARAAGLDALFLNVSFVNGDELAKTLGPDGNGVIVTQVVPHPESSLPICARFRRAMAALPDSPPPTIVALEGYVASQMLLRAIATIDGDVTRERIVEALEQMGDFDLGLEVNLSLSPTRHQASRAIWPTMLSDGAVRPIEWSEIRNLVNPIRP